MNTHAKYRSIPDDDQIAKDLQSIRALEEITLYPIEFIATIEQDEDGFYLDGYSMFAGGEMIYTKESGQGKHRSELANMLHESLMYYPDDYQWLRRPSVPVENIDAITDEDIAALQGAL